MPGHPNQRYVSKHNKAKSKIDEISFALAFITNGKNLRPIPKFTWTQPAIRICQKEGKEGFQTVLSER